jgi:hypothetical protein
MHDRYEEARDNLLKLHTLEEATIEIAQIQGQMRIDRTLDSSYLNMFKKPSYRKRSLLAIGTTCAIQFSGILVINSWYSLHALDITYTDFTIDYGPTVRGFFRS